MRPSLLLSIPQCPFDSSSGAALVERATCEMLAQAGWKVRVIGTTATESSDPGAGARSLAALGYEIKSRPFGPAKVAEFEYRGVHYRLVTPEAGSVNHARALYKAELDSLLDAAITEERPDVLLTYGSSVAEIRRRAQARLAGARVVFSLHNFAYRSEDAFRETDVVLTPSRAVTEHYRLTHGIDSLAIPVPLSLEQIVPPTAEPHFFTFINPTPIKGVHFFLRVAQLSAEQWPELPFLVVESRGSAETLIQAALQCNVDLLKLNLRMVRNTPNPAQIYAVTRAVLMPSLNEPGGRVAAEAMVNGIPAVVSDRGGLPEMVGSAGFVVPVSLQFDTPEGERAVHHWVKLLGRLYSDENFYQAASRRAIEHTAAYRNGQIECQRVRVFERVAGGESVVDLKESYAGLLSLS